MKKNAGCNSSITTGISFWIERFLFISYHSDESPPGVSYR